MRASSPPPPLRCNLGVHAPITPQVYTLRSHTPPRRHRSFHFKVPPLTRGSKNIVTQHLENLLKQQMCLEKVLTLNAIAVGQTIEYLRELQGDAAFEATAERLLRQVKAPVRAPSQSGLGGGGGSGSFVAGFAWLCCTP